MPRHSHLTLELPMPLNIANARMHWRVKANARRAYYSTLDTMLAAKLLPPPPQSPIAHPRIASVMTLGNKMDHDNAMARHKWPCDWLQRRGYIANDKDLEWAGLPTQRVTRSSPSKITLTLSQGDQ
jgi:hypothetical protein